MGGLKGDFQIGGHKFNYDVYGNYGRTTANDTTQDLNAQNFINAVNVTTDANGNIVCTTNPTTQASPNGGTPIADPKCVPLNLLGLGRSSQAARNYVISRNTQKTFIDQLDFNANVGGELFKLFGNEISANIGAERRQEKGRFTPSQFDQQGLGRNAPVPETVGGYNVTEGYGEFLAPLIQPRNDLFGVYRLSAFGSVRYTSNSNNGGSISWAAGGAYSPIRDFELHGNYTRSFRSPSITELYLPTSVALGTFVNDLCSPSNIGSGPAPAVRARNCAAFLAKYPNATPLDAANASVPSLSGGNPRLANESATSFTFGATATPRFLPGFRVSADYINITIRNPIANLDLPTITSACFDNTNFNAADPANGNNFCSQIKRYAPGQGGAAANGGDRGGQVVFDTVNPGVTNGYINGNQVKFSGVTTVFTYDRQLSDLHIPLPGSIHFGGNVLYVEYRQVDLTGVAPVRSDGLVGGSGTLGDPGILLGDPKLSGNFDVVYKGANWGTNLNIIYTGKQIFSQTSRGPDKREFDALADFETFNAGFYFDIGPKQKGMRLNFEVTNLLNRQGQSFNGVLIPASYSDLIGRTYSVGLHVRY